MRYLLTDHAFTRSEERDISIKEINDAVTKGKQYKSALYGGQLRFYYNGICVIVRKSTNKILTVYRLKHR